MSILKQLQEVLKVIFLTETKCKISFKIHLQKWGKKWMEISAIMGGRGAPTLRANAIKDFHTFF